MHLNGAVISFWAFIRRLFLDDFDLAVGVLIFRVLLLRFIDHLDVVQVVVVYVHRRGVLVLLVGWVTVRGWGATACARDQWLIHLRCHVSWNSAWRWWVLLLLLRGLLLSLPCGGLRWLDALASAHCFDLKLLDWAGRRFASWLQTLHYKVAQRLLDVICAILWFQNDTFILCEKFRFNDIPGFSRILLILRNINFFGSNHLMHLIIDSLLSDTSIASGVSRVSKSRRGIAMRSHNLLRGSR